MKENPVKWIGYLSFFALLFFSCSGTGTELTQKHVDDAYKGKPVSDILVIAITGNEHNRRSFEKKFVSHLKAVGVDAVASEEAVPMPADLELKKETILNAVNQYENDAVIITHLIGKEEKDVYTRGGSPHGGLYGFYRSRYSYSHDPGYSSTSTTVRLQTNLYDVKTEKLIWSGKSNSWSKDAKGQIINDVIKAVINDLQKNKLIAPKL
jgi:PBP1b-binding outer membrane lipoprotein LpoB